MQPAWLDVANGMFERSNEETVREKSAARKLLRHMDRAAARGDAPATPTLRERSPAELRRGVCELYRVSAVLVPVDPSRPPAPTEPEPESAEELAFFWRKLLLAWLKEDVPHLPVRCNEDCIALWNQLYTFKAGRHCNIEMDKGAEALIQGEISPTGERAVQQRYVAVTSRAKAAAEAYEHTWTPLRTLTDSRMLDVIGSSAGQHSACTSGFQRADAAEMARQGRGYCEGMRLMRQPEEPAAFRALSHGVQRQLSECGWLPAWHDAMQRASLDYGSLDDRVRAVHDISAAPEADINCPADWSEAVCFNGARTPLAWRVRETKRSTSHSCSYSHCPEGFYYGSIPENKHKYCGACRSAAYCSQGCQVSHWKDHKPRCLELRRKTHK